MSDASRNCGGCKYSLNGLPDEGVCPECGAFYRFRADWDEVWAAKLNSLENRYFILQGTALLLLCVSFLVVFVGLLIGGWGFGEALVLAGINVVPHTCYCIVLRIINPKNRTLSIVLGTACILPLILSQVVLFLAVFVGNTPDPFSMLAIFLFPFWPFLGMGIAIIIGTIVYQVHYRG